jgi:hypothetical protein
VKLLWEINPTKGDLQVTAAGGHGQISDLSLAGAYGNDRSLRPMLVPREHRWVSAELPGPAVTLRKSKPVSQTIFAKDPIYAPISKMP